MTLINAAIRIFSLLGMNVVVAEETVKEPVFVIEQQSEYIVRESLPQEFNQEQVQALIVQYMSQAGYSTSEIDTWLFIAEKESMFQEDARGYAGAFYGVYQIYTGTWDWYGCEGDIFNAVDNIKCAIKIEQREGWYPWHAYTANFIY